MAFGDGGKVQKCVQFKSVKLLENSRFCIFQYVNKKLSSVLFSVVGAAALSASVSFGLSACASSNAVPPAVEATRAESGAVGSPEGPAVRPPVPKPPVTVFEMRVIDANRQVRVVEKPTLAALDFAAYFANPIRLAGKDETPENYKGTMALTTVAEYPFPMLDSISEYEPAAIAGLAPIVWEPFSKMLYTQTGSDSLAQVLNAVEAVKWNEPDVFRAFQTVTRLWGVPTKGSAGSEANSSTKVEWWVEVMPAVWTKRAPFYAKLKFASTGETAEILNFYLTAEMNAEDAMNWARTLSSYWYPTLNTDLEQHTPGDIWPAGSRNKPFAVMRGNPMGTPMWIAFEVPAFAMSDEDLWAKRKADSLAAAGEVVPVNRTLDTSSTARLETLAAMENSCPANAETNAFRDALTKQMAKLPKEQNAWAAVDAGGKTSAEKFLWFRRNANYLLADKISAQDSLHNPLPRMVELKQYLDSLGIQLLVVPVPVKEEVYADKLVPGTRADLCVNVNGREFIREMLTAGIDVLDLYPALMSARASDEPPHYSYQRFDTHWALPGMLAAMEQLATRVTQYSWYAESGAQPGSLVMKDTLTLREGDLVAHLPDAEKSKYPADTLAAMKVFKGENAYKGGKNAPILLMGDSFTGVFESVDQKSGGPGSLLAYATGLDVQVATSWGGGPGVRSRMMKMQKDLAAKRLVIYMMTARDFWQSPMEWDALR